MKTIFHHIRKALTFWFISIILLGSAMQANAQQNSSAVIDPFESQYFTNRYLGNPSMAGRDSGLNLNAAYRQQFNGIPGAPITQAFSADYNSGKRVGLGLIAYNDKAGLINNTRFALTYAYHLPVGAYSQELHFGISGAFAHTQLDPKGIIGDQTDPSIADFNGRKNKFEIDYGMAYTDTHMTLQASLANLIGYMNHFNNTTADEASFYAAAAYKFILNGPVNSIEPQASLRGIKNYNSVADLGINMIMFQHLLNIYGMYHTSGNFSAGVGLHYKDILYIQGSYLSKIAGLKDYTDGNFEVDLTISLFRHQ